jgi:hypothetical protein
MDFYIEDPELLRFSASTLNNAVEKLFNYLTETYCIEFSETAKKPKNFKPMYIDISKHQAKQVGYIFTGSLEIAFDNEYKKRYLSIWCSVSESIDIEF